MYNENELYIKAKCEFFKLCDNVNYMDDAVQEYVIAAWEVGQGGNCNGSLQLIRGKSRMIDFLRKQTRYNKKISALRMRFSAPEA